ncbi:MAG: hypothetical protein Kow0026_22970 [Oricola sp.]
MKRFSAAFACFALLAKPVPLAAAETCGWYVVLGCDRSEAAMARKRAIIAALADDGTTRAKVVRTDDYPNFRDGWYCLVDGPFESRGRAASVDWGETVGETYVKSGC